MKEADVWSEIWKRTMRVAKTYHNWKSGNIDERIGVKRFSKAKKELYDFFIMLSKNTKEYFYEEIKQEFENEKGKLVN